MKVTFIKFILGSKNKEIIVTDMTTTASMLNADAPFTELFSLLVKYDVSNSKKVKLAYSSSALRAIRQHSDNV